MSQIEDLKVEETDEVVGGISAGQVADLRPREALRTHQMPGPQPVQMEPETMRGKRA